MGRKKKQEDREDGVTDFIQVLEDNDPTEALIARCEIYLSGLHTTLWGKYYNVVDEKMRREAAEWLAAQLVGVVLSDTEGT